jgi:hypothetical protein
MTVGQLIEKLTALVAENADNAAKDIVIIDDGSTIGEIEFIDNDAEDLDERYNLKNTIVFGTDTHEFEFDDENEDE